MVACLGCLVGAKRCIAGELAAWRRHVEPPRLSKTSRAGGHTSLSRRLYVPQSPSSRSHAQAFAWPALTKIFMSWFPRPDQRGAWYGVLATCQNLGAALGPVVAMYAAERYGWTARLYLPGLLAVGYGLLCVFAVQDKPGVPVAATSTAAAISSLPHTSAATTALSSTAAADGGGRTRRRRYSVPHNTAPVVAAQAAHAVTTPLQQQQPYESPPHPKTPGLNHHATGRIAYPNTPAPMKAHLQHDTAASSGAHGGKMTVSDMIKSVLSSPVLWILGVNYLFNSLIRNGVTSGLRSYVESGANGGLGLGHVSTLSPSSLSTGAAESANFWYEAGGALGGFASGLLSDRIFGGRRGPVMAIFGVLLAPAVLLLGHPEWCGITSESLQQARLAAVASKLEGLALSGGGNAFAIAHEAPSFLSSPHVRIAGIYFLIGLCAFPPHVLNGLVSRELAHPSVLSSAGGFTKSLGQVGSAVADLYILRAADAYGWPIVMRYLSVFALVSALVVLPLWWALPHGSSAADVAESAAGRRIKKLTTSDKTHTRASGDVDANDEADNAVGADGSDGSSISDADGGGGNNSNSSSGGGGMVRFADRVESVADGGAGHAHDNSSSNNQQQEHEQTGGGIDASGTNGDEALEEGEVRPTVVQSRAGTKDRNRGGVSDGGTGGGGGRSNSIAATTSAARRSGGSNAAGNDGSGGGGALDGASDGGQRMAYASSLSPTRTPADRLQGRQQYQHEHEQDSDTDTGGGSPGAVPATAMPIAVQAGGPPSSRRRSIVSASPSASSARHRDSAVAGVQTTSSKTRGASGHPGTTTTTTTPAAFREQPSVSSSSSSATAAGVDECAATATSGPSSVAGYSSHSSLHPGGLFSSPQAKILGPLAASAKTPLLAAVAAGASSAVKSGRNA